MLNRNFSEGFNCPMAKMDYETVQLGHGSGGKLMNELIDKVFIRCFDNEILKEMEDQANLEVGGSKIVFTTDSFVVDPLFFPGGNIGELAVYGTVNDLCVGGAEPLFLSSAFILEEGFSLEELHKISVAMRNAADLAGVKIVTGDTKVVNKGSCDKVFINTAGIGIVKDDVKISASNLQAGDKLIISGSMADHGMAIMTKREGLSFESDIESDTAALNGLVKTMLDTTKNIHAMRDPTRGGVAATLNDFARQSGKGIKVTDGKVPVKENVRGACEILGIDPYFVANEGKLICSVAAEDADKLLDAMKAHPLGKDAAIFGEVVDDHPGIVSIVGLLGVEQIMDVPLGEQLPRIC